MASAYGVENAMDLSISDSELLPKLEQAVLALEANETTVRGIDTFVNDITSNPKELSIRQYVQTTLDNKVIVFDILRSSYFYSTEKGERIKLLEIFKIDTDKRQEVLINHFLNNEFEANKLEEYITGEIITPKEHVPTKEEIEQADWVGLQRLGRACGVFVKGMKKDVLFDKLMEHYEYSE